MTCCLAVLGGREYLAQQPFAQSRGGLGGSILPFPPFSLPSSVNIYMLRTWAEGCICTFL